MRILTQKEIKQKPDSLTDEVRKSLKVKRLIEDNKQNYDQLRASLDPRKEKLQKEFNEFVTHINKRKSELFAEVESLEKRREKALEPLDDKWLELQEKEVLLTDFEKHLKKQALSVETDKEQVKEQLAYISGKEQELLTRESSISKKEKESSEREIEGKKIVAALSKNIQEFRETVKSTESRLSVREKIVEDKENSFGLIDIAQDKREKDLDTYKARLDDRAATLDRGFQELNNKHGRG